MNGLNEAWAQEDLTNDAMAMLERVVIQVLQHNWTRNQHSAVRRWVRGEGREPDSARLGLVSTAAAQKIRTAHHRGQPIDLGEVSEVIGRMQRDMGRVREREVRRSAERRARGEAGAADRHAA
jgi:hypothetical protein